MEMCVDNPRQGFADLFATHPSIDARVAALVQYAGGHDPGPIALPPPPDEPYSPDEGDGNAPPEGEKPFLPGTPPVTLGNSAEQAPPAQPPGPWGPARGG